MPKKNLRILAVDWIINKTFDQVIRSSEIRSSDPLSKKAVIHGSNKTKTKPEKLFKMNESTSRETFEEDKNKQKTLSNTWIMKNVLLPNSTSLTSILLYKTRPLESKKAKRWFQFQIRLVFYVWVKKYKDGQSTKMRKLQENFTNTIQIRFCVILKRILMQLHFEHVTW